MGVIVELDVASQQFELGRILGMEEDTRVNLETMVPMGDRTVPFFRAHGAANGFEESVSGHPSVSEVHVVSTHNGEVLYALDWDIAEDDFFKGLVEAEANILEATGDPETWQFDLRFQSHDSLSAFQDHCVEHSIPIDVRRLYNPTKPDAGPWFGLTSAQRTTLTRAVEAGYYSIPRGTSTQELGAQFEISDQAVTERLRRAVRNLVTATLTVADSA